MKYLFPVTATHRDGHTKLLYTVKEVLDFVYNSRKTRYGAFYVGAEWVEYKEFGYYRIYDSSEHKNDWILRDDRGRPVDYKTLEAPSLNYKNKKGEHTFRDGPVPHRCGYRGCWKFDAPRKRHGGKGVLARGEAHRREFVEEMFGQRTRRHFYVD